MQQTIIVDDFNCLEQFSQENSFGSSIISCYTESKKELSLESIRHQIEVKNGIGINTVSLIYTNDFTSDNPIYFMTQVPKNVTLIGIKAKFANEEIESIVKQKMPDQVFEDYSDIIRLQLGTLPARQNVSIIYEYVEQLQVQVNEFWRIEISPPFIQYSEIQQKYLNKYFILKNSQNYNQEIKIEFDRQLVFYKSPTHQIELKKIGQKNIISISQDRYFNKNTFVLLYQYQLIHKPQLLLTHVAEEVEVNQKYCATIQFIPQFNKLQRDDAYQAYIQNDDIDNQEFDFSSKGEYLFLLDRSISMGGSKLNKAKQALSLFIKSLPKDSYFNIVSFGTEFKFQFEQSVNYTIENVNQALNSLQNFDADLGGTNIKQAIDRTLNLQRQAGFQRNIFLLTDGEDYYADATLQLVSKSSMPDVRFYAIGIGKKCNQFFLQKIAFLGNGIYQIIEEDGDLNQCVMIMLSDSITPIYSNFKIQTNLPNESISMIVSHFREINAIKKNKPISFQVLFNFGDQKNDYYIKISYQNENMIEQEIIIPIDRDDSLETDYLHKLAIQQQIQKVLEYAQVKQNILQSLNKNPGKLSKQKLIDLSVKYQVVTTPLTSLQTSTKKIGARNSSLLPQINTKNKDLARVDDLNKKIRFIGQVAQIPAVNTQQEQIKHKASAQNLIEKYNQADYKLKANKLAEILITCSDGYFKQEVLQKFEMENIDISKISTYDHLIQANIITLKILENQFYEFSETWILISKKVKEFLLNKQINYHDVKKLVILPNQLQRPQVIIQQSQFIKEQKQKIEQQDNQPKDPLKQKRFDQIQNTFRSDFQIDESILIILEYDKQNLIAATNLNTQLCILVIITLENVFPEFESSWKLKVSQYKQYLSANEEDYLKLQKQLQIPKLNFNKETQELIDRELQKKLKVSASILSIKNKFQGQKENLSDEQIKNKTKKLNEILNQFDLKGQVKQNLIQILQINLDDIIIGEQLTVDQKLAILTLSILEEKFKDQKDQWNSKHIKCSLDYLQKQCQIDYKSDYQGKIKLPPQLFKEF